ncbi:MAG: hypothetical protein GXP55_03125 [Deltaproteobacteria bacterium]|nr:hypothetical protein [Deltaproteobacteria bacterium]
MKKFFGETGYITKMDTEPESPDPDPNDVWAFTDPDARDTYEQQGKRAKLEQDIRFEVMRGEPWRAEDLEYKRELRRLLQEGTITDKGSYWFSSPFPTVYRAKKSGTLSVAGKTFSFRKNDDIVYQCPMTRDMKGHSGDPVLVAQLKPTSKSTLCGDMSSAMKGGMGGGGMGGM